MEKMEGLGKMIKIHADTLWHRAERWYTPGRVGELGEWRFLPTLPGESRPSLISCESHQSHRNWLTQSGWLTAIGIYFLISLKDRCPKSSCQQGLLPLKALDKYSSLPLPGGSWQRWCSFPCSCVTPTSVPSLHALWPCVFVPFPLLRWTPVIEFRTHLIQHDIFLTNSLGKTLFPSKATSWVSGCSFLEADTIHITTLMLCLIRGSVYSAAAECSAASTPRRSIEPPLWNSVTHDSNALVHFINYWEKCDNIIMIWIFTSLLIVFTSYILNFHTLYTNLNFSHHPAWTFSFWTSLYNMRTFPWNLLCLIITEP